MSEILIDQDDRDRFRMEWNRNFAVSANAGSGKTTAISERLASMALSPEAAPLLRKTAVVTFTKKAAVQIGQRARSVLLRRLTETDAEVLDPLDHLEHAFFGTIHSFCLLLAQRYGQMLGINLDPAVMPEKDDEVWEEFLDQDAMQFASLTSSEIDAFLRHVPLEEIFPLARVLDRSTARRYLRRGPAGPMPGPSQAALEQLLALIPKGSGKRNLELSQASARRWQAGFEHARGFLPLYGPLGRAAGLVQLAHEWMKPLKTWLADAAAVLAAELAERYRAYRFDQGIQTYADQIEDALAVLHDMVALERIRSDGWRVILDEAQDTDAQQFAVLVEITRPPGSALGTWPQGQGSGPRPGCFCMVGDGQQAIYGSRAEIRNFTRYLAAFERGDGGELLRFRATFRSPHQVITFLNTGFPGAFGPSRSHNFGLAPAEGASAPILQVRYEKLEAGPGNAEGWTTRFPLSLTESLPTSVDDWQAEEASQLATFLKKRGPAAVGARHWGDICLLAPRNDWLATTRRIFESAGLKVAFQMRRNRNGDNPVYAWMTGLLALVSDPQNAFEWFGVLREIFGVSDAQLAQECRKQGGFQWDEPEAHAEPLRSALTVVRPWILRANDEGQGLGTYVAGLVQACGLREKAWRVDPSGGVATELDRLLVEAATIGLEGASPLQWWRELVGALDEGRPLGKPEDDAINLLSAHSSKGLEWPVVIPLGLWRGIGKPPEPGLRMIVETGGETLIYFDQTSIPMETREARERERLRELVRLLYVTFTRARRHLIIPWHAEFGGKQRVGVAFAHLWGDHALFDSLPNLETEPFPGGKEEISEIPPVEADSYVSGPFKVSPRPPLPTRLLPHLLAGKPDLVRASLHDSAIDDLMPVRAGDEALDYGHWWHSALEHIPWKADAAELRAYCESAIETARPQNFAARGAAEINQFLESRAWKSLKAADGQHLAELAIFAPFEDNAWIDGIMDLLVENGDEIWVVDWKTNRRRAAESPVELLERLSAEYAPQLRAYGRSAQAIFPSRQIRLWIYGTAAGDWMEIHQ